MKYPKFLFIFLFAGVCCNKNTKAKSDPSAFVATPIAFAVQSGNINEASGLVSSIRNPGFLFTLQDSGNPAEMIVITDSGKYTGRVSIDGVVNRDWEDMALANGPSHDTKYVYIAETGDNKERYDSYAIYRFEEPMVGDKTVSQVDKINFVYEDGSHDSEAMLVDNNSLDIYLVTKRDARALLYKLSYPQQLDKINTAVFVGELPFTNAVGASLSADNTEVIIKTYSTIYYWKKKANESLERILKMSYSNPDYVVEPQGEAICFDSRNKGFFTLSEKRSTLPLSLNLYKRK